MSQNTNLLYKTKTSKFYVDKIQLPLTDTKKNLLPKIRFEGLSVN